jgi:hypothetical protein
MIATQISNSNFIDISFSFIASCNLKVFKVSGHGINWHILLLNHWGCGKTSPQLPIWSFVSSNYYLLSKLKPAVKFDC